MIEVEIEDEAWRVAEPLAGELAEAAAAAALAHNLQKDRVELVILLTGDDEVRLLNERFRGKDAATNVLSFPAPETAVGQLGDIALGHGVCSREAAEQGKPLAHHLQHLTVHGVLHLLGYDHQLDAEADSMEALERVILAELGVPDPYADRGDQGDHG